jgi:rubredoxin
MMPREMVSVHNQRFTGWACSECAWVFNPSSSPKGESLDEMKRNFELQRDKEFATHVCNKHPRATN